jgi:uncharacterized protein YndB with AHSA1/START domain
MTQPIATSEIEICRTYDAPRDVVFAMWTEAEHLARWWGPDGFAAPRVESDPRPGGELVIEMVGHGMEQTLRARYREVVVPELLVVDAVVTGPDGQPFLESSHRVTFAEHGGRTDVTVQARASVFVEAARAALEGMQAGWRQSLQCLDDVVTGAVDRQVVLLRMFDAPPEDVFAYWTEQRHLEQWWGPEGFTVTVHAFDPRPGGRWTFTMRGPDGTEYPNSVRYDEIVSGERLVYTHGEPSDPDPPFTGVVTFDEMGGRTVLSMRLVFDSPDARDLVVEKYHAVEGGNQTLDRLARLLDAG